MNRGVTYLPPVDGHDERVLNADATSRIREKEKKNNLSHQSVILKCQPRAPISPPVKTDGIPFEQAASNFRTSARNRRAVVSAAEECQKATLPVAWWCH